MPMINLPLPFAFIAFLTSGRADKNGQSFVHSALPFSHPVGAQVARQRCPIFQPGFVSLSFISPCAKVTFLLCSLGDISTLP